MKRVDQWEVVAAVAKHASNLTTCNAYRIASTLDKLARIARTLTRYYTWQCNEDTSGHTCKECGGKRPGPHTFTNCAGAKVYALQERAEKLGAELGLYVENQTDPRGASIKLYTGQAGACLGVFS